LMSFALEINETNYWPSWFGLAIGYAPAR